MIVRSLSPLLLGLCFILSISETSASSTAIAITQNINAYIEKEINSLTQPEEKQRYQNATILVSEINPELKLKDCDGELTVSNISIPIKRVRQSAKVSCAKPTPWSVLVPLSIEPAEKDAINSANVIDRTKTLINEQLSGVVNEAANLAGYDLSISNDFLIEKELPKSCSEYIELKLKDKSLKPGKLYVDFYCHGLTHWQVHVPFILSFQQLKPFDRQQIETSVTEFINKKLLDNKEFTEQYSRTSFSIKAITDQATTCQGSLSYELQNEKLQLGRNTLLIKCSLFVDWSIALQFDVVAYQKIAVAIRPILSGEKIVPADIEFREIDALNALPQQAFAESQVVGFSAKSPIPAGQPILLKQLEAAKAIIKGDEVMLSATLLGIQVKIPGEALMDGVLGEQIRVRNKQSNKIVSGRIAGPGQVEVLL